MQAGQGPDAVQEVRSSLTVISMAAMKQPHLVAERLDLLLKVRTTSPTLPSSPVKVFCMQQLQFAAGVLDSLCLAAHQYLSMHGKTTSSYASFGASTLSAVNTPAAVAQHMHTTSSTQFHFMIAKDTYRQVVSLLFGIECGHTSVLHDASHYKLSLPFSRWASAGSIRMHSPFARPA